MDAPKSGAEHYNTPYYQRTVELERAAENGVTPHELYKQETAFVLKHMQGLGEGEGILDIGSGIGEHARMMSDAFSHRVPIRGIDGAAALVEEANRIQLRRYHAGIREDVRFLVGDMIAIPRDVMEERIRFVTCLGSSFGFHNAADLQTVMKGLYAMLEPGGKFILQFREKAVLNGKEMADLERARADLGVNVDNTTVHDQKVTKYFDTQQGDSVCLYRTDCPHPDPMAQQEYSAVYQNSARNYRHTSGLEYMSFGRYYVDPHGNEHHLSPTMILTHFTMEKHWSGIASLFQEAGFEHLTYHRGERVGMHQIAALVSQKPE